MPKGARRQPLLDRVLLLLVFILVAFAPVCLEAQATHGRKNPGAATAKSQSSRSQNQKPQLLFNYYPAVLGKPFKESEMVFVAIAKDGSTQAVRYGPYNPAIIAVYEGKLPKADVARLVARTQLAIPKASEINIPYAVSCDAETFELSINPPDGAQSFMQYPGCLIVMPKDIMELVEEMRTLWRRLDESRLAYGYVRSFPLNEDFLKSPQRTAKQFVSIEKFPPQLRAIARDARKQTPKFYALSQKQYGQLLALTRDPSHSFDLKVVDNGRGYSLKLVQSRKSGQTHGA